MKTEKSDVCQEINKGKVGKKVFHKGQPGEIIEEDLVRIKLDNGKIVISSGWTSR